MNDLLCRYILNLNKIVDEFFKHSNIKQAMTKFLKKKCWLVFFAFYFNLFQGLQGQVYHHITDAGAWCWFSDPRAIYLHGKETSVLTGWVKEDGSIEAARINLKTKEIQKQILFNQLEKDDHDNPAFLELADNGYIAFYAKHGRGDLYYHRNSEKEDQLFGEVTIFDPIGKEELEKFPRRQVTYANPVQLSNENNRIYCFGRWTGYKPNMMWSEDNGKTFTKSKVFIAEEGFRNANRPYVKYYSDGKSRIHFIFTDGHPRDEPINSVYYAYYEQGAFWRADGTKICNLQDIPFKPKEATVVYQATMETGRAWVHDIVADKKGHPTILYTRYPTEQEHIYSYAQFDGKQWHNHFICNSGSWFPQTKPGEEEKEPNYSAGLILHPLHLNTVYLSRKINGIFEIEKWVTKNHGQDWTSTTITANSKYDNVRPFIPRNMRRKDKTMLLWMVNEKYIHYTDYKTSINFIIE